MSDPVQNTTEDTIYENETLRHRHIRLLTIRPRDSGDADDSMLRCTLQTVRLDDEQPPCYTALSYTWGDNSNKVRIEVNGKDFEATRNLHSALQHFRNTQDPIPTLWVDAICINQNHDNEKEAQVQFMQSIFSGAKETWAWLNHEADESNKAIALINYLATLYLASCNGGNTDPEKADKTRWGSLKSRGIEDELDALDHLLTRPYWYRVWIVQEIVLSKNIVFFCGSRKFSWQALLFAAYLLNSHEETDFIHNRSNKRVRSRGISGGIQRILSVQSVRYDYQQNLKGELRDSLLSLLSNHRSTGATNPKDKFIALAGLAGVDAGKHSIKDPMETERSQTQVTTDGLYAMEVGEVYAFSCNLLTKEKRYKPLDFLDSAGLPRNHPMPSWVPDWSVIIQCRPSPLLYWQLASKKHEKLVHINVAGKPRPLNRSTFSILEKAILQAAGRIVGSIQAVITAPDGSEPLLGHNPDQTTRVRAAYPTGEQPADVLWKTLVLDRDLADGVKAPEHWGDVFYQHIFQSSTPSLLQQWWMQCKHFKLCGSTLEELAEARNRRPSSPSHLSNPDEELARLKSAFTIGVGRRKLATTENGYLCLVPLDADAGDIVVILVDCSAPVLLRKSRNESPKYEFIGTCYVHGIMHGKLVDELDVQNPFPECFDIQ
jgi:Heterokaryon incompatibility protein (HET)